MDSSHVTACMGDRSITGSLVDMGKTGGRQACKMAFACLAALPSETGWPQASILSGCLGLQVIGSGEVSQFSAAAQVGLVGFSFLLLFFFSSFLCAQECYVLARHWPAVSCADPPFFPPAFGAGCGADLKRQAGR